MIHADYGGGVSELAQEGSEYVKAGLTRWPCVHLNDKDREESIRAYFGLEC